MKNILLVTQGFPFGQKERGFLPAEYDALHEHHHLTVLAFDNGDSLVHPVHEDVEHFRYSWPEHFSLLQLLAQFRYREVRQDAALAFRNEKKRFPKRAAAISAFSLRAEQMLPRLREIVIEKNIEIVYTYWCIQATIAALRLKKEFPGLKVITRFHGMDLYPERREAKWQALYPFVAAQSDGLLFVSETGRDFFLNTWGRQWQGKTMVSYIGCRAMPVLPQKDTSTKLVLVSCSNMIPIKRIELLMEALPLLPDSLQVEWHHLGEGELHCILEERAALLMENKQNIICTFHGHIPNPEVPATYQRIGAQLFITTSSTEGLPVTLMEAYAMGLPVIATAVGGIPEMLTDGKTGFLLPANPTAQQVAESILRYVRLPDEVKYTMSQKALQKWQKDFDAKHNAELLMSFFDDEA